VLLRAKPLLLWIAILALVALAVVLTIAAYDVLEGMRHLKHLGPAD
jgi:hypothetical protein